TPSGPPKGGTTSGRAGRKLWRRDHFVMVRHRLIRLVDLVLDRLRFRDQVFDAGVEAGQPVVVRLLFLGEVGRFLGDRFREGATLAFHLAPLVAQRANGLVV